MASRIAHNRSLPKGYYEFAVLSSVRGYHMYKDIWGDTNGVTLPYLRELNDRHNSFTVGLPNYRGCNLCIGRTLWVNKFLGFGWNCEYHRIFSPYTI